MEAFRNDLIDTIKPFFSQLNNNNKEQYNINEEKRIPFLKSFSNFELEVLHKYKIINEEIYSNIAPFLSTISTTNSSEEFSTLSFILITGNEDPTNTMQDQYPERFYDYEIRQEIEIKRYEWDCMVVVIYYGKVEIMKILEEKGKNPAYIEADINAKDIIYQIIIILFLSKII